jgi:molybdate transport system substrate-binding protein
MVNDARRTWALLAVAALGASCSRGPTELTIGAATSLREVVPALIRSYEAAHPGVHVSATYAASGELKRQLEAGAPMDAILLAAPKPLDELIAEGRLESSSRVLASNELVLAGRQGGPRLTFETLASLAPDDKLAVGDPRTVPAGEYAKDYLRALGEWDALQPHLVLAANVAAALVYARRGEAVAAVVYRTELRGAPELVVLDVAHGPVAPHPKVVGASARGYHPAAQAFLDLATSPEGAKLFASFGFGPP